MPRTGCGRNLKIPSTSDPAAQYRVKWGRTKKKCWQDRFSLKPRARLDLRPPLSYYTALSQSPRSVGTASSPADSRRGSRGPRANRRSPGLGKSRQVRTRQRSAWADYRARGSGVLHTPAPLVWCTSYLLTLNPRDPPRRSRPEPASPWGPRSQTDEIPAKTPAFNEGGATEKPAPGGALARSLRDPVGTPQVLAIIFQSRTP